MPRFQPGPSRYFGNTARPVSSVTASSLPSAHSIYDLPSPIPPPLFQPRNKPHNLRPLAIGKNEQLEITKKLLKMPHFVPAATTKNLKKFAQRVLSNKSAYTKDEQIFAAGALHQERRITDTGHQKKFIAGEAEALVDIKDRHIKNPYNFSHHIDEVAGQTYRSVTKDFQKKEPPKSVKERRASIRSGDESSSSTPTGGSGWVAPVALGGSHEPENTTVEENNPSSWTAPYKPQSETGIPSNAVHASHHYNYNHPNSGTGSDIMLLSNNLSEAELRRWEKVVPRRMTRLPIVSAPLIKAFPSWPKMIIIDGTEPLRPELLGLPQKQLPIFVIIPPETAPLEDEWAAWEPEFVSGKFIPETVMAILTRAEHKVASN